MQQPVRLLTAGYIARKENHACRLQSREQGTELRGHLGSVETDDEQLPDLSRD
jgi:hypothetical protein